MDDYCIILPDIISIHALREEGDADHLMCAAIFMDFYPRPPRGGRPVVANVRHKKEVFLSTPSARRATRPIPRYFDKMQISIHALREEGDAIIRMSLPASPNFYPRPPRGGRRQFSSQLQG